MKKYFKKFVIMFVMALILSLGFCISAFATDDGIAGTANLNNTTNNSAKVGGQLKAPEVGWKRYDDTNSNIIYNGSYDNSHQAGNAWNDYVRILKLNGSIKFEFYGTQFRLIGINDPNQQSSNINVSIDGNIVDSFSQRKSPWQGYILSYESNELANSVHEVTITDLDSTNPISNFVVDAIDIKGNILPYDESIILDKSTMDLTEGDSAELTATTTPAEVGVTWAVSDPTVASIEVDPTNGKITKITTLKEGTCTITATTEDGNNLSASCIINVTKKDTTDPNTPPDDSDNKTVAILIINLTDGETKVFDVSASEAAKFKEWYNTKTEYENQITYEFDRTVNSSISVEEDVVHDQVTSYEIRKY